MSAQEHPQARRVRQIAAGILREENRGVSVKVKVGDGRDRAYRLRKDAA